jgi:hypothetical protein
VKITALTQLTRAGHPLKDDFQVASITIEVPAGQLPINLASAHILGPRSSLPEASKCHQGCVPGPPLTTIPFHTILTHASITDHGHEEKRVYGELYNSDEFIKEHKRVQNCSPPPPDDPTNVNLRRSLRPSCSGPIQPISQISEQQNSGQSTCFLGICQSIFDRGHPLVLVITSPISLRYVFLNISIMCVHSPTRLQLP